MKRLRKENAQLKRQLDKQQHEDKAKLKEIKKELSQERKKRRQESEALRRTMEVAFELVPGYRFSIQIILLCVLIYARTSCCLRTVVEIMGIFEEHEDVVVLGMAARDSFKRTDVHEALRPDDAKTGQKAEYTVSDGAHHLGGGIRDYGIPHHLDISHTLGNCIKYVYGEDDDFKELTTKLRKIRLQYHLTGKVWLLPPNMRAIARFMNLHGWVTWANDMLGCIDPLKEDLQEAFGFVRDYRSLIEELNVGVEAIRHLEDICKNRGTAGGRILYAETTSYAMS